MTKILKKINNTKNKTKIAMNKLLTNAGLRIFTHNRKLKGILFKKNVSYGKNKLQKFDIITPDIAKKIPVVFYFHGGAWSAGDKYGYTMFCQDLADKGYFVCNVNYRLMPKVSIQKCADDCIQCIRFFTRYYKQILKNLKINCEPNFDNTFLVGDSAGAHLASFIAGLLTTEKKKLPIKILALGLYYGVYNFENLDEDPSQIMQDLNKYWQISENNFKEIYKKMSIQNYLTKKFPPCFLTSGAIDKLHLQTEEFVKVLKNFEIDIDYLSFPKSRVDAEHAFLNARFLASSKEAFERLIKFFERKTHEKER